jgi:glycosyltransferase involved in cell wall biosynthesis
MKKKEFIFQKAFWPIIGLFKNKLKKDYRKTILIMLWKDLKHPYAGGAIFNAFAQAEVWLKQGYRVIFLTPMFKGASTFEVIKGSEVYRVGNKFSNYPIFCLWYILKFRKIADYVIDIENGIPYFTPLYVRKPKILLVHHIHKKVFFQELPWFIAWLPYLLEVYLMPLVYRKSKVIAVSNETKKELCKIGFKPEQIFLSYNAIAHEKAIIKPKFKNPTIFSMGRVEKYKRIELLINLFEELNYPDSKLIIGGDGRHLETIKKKVENSKYKDRIKVLGRISEEEKFDLFAKSWLYATASSAEGWGITVLEANACNTPAISFDVPGLNEAIKDGINGYVAKDYQDFIRKAKKILDLKGKIGDPVEYASQFTWEKAAKDTLKVLSKRKRK